MASPVEVVTRADDRLGSGSLGHYLVGATALRTADEGARVGLALLAVERMGSAALGGLLIAALLVPHFVAAPLVGTLVDRAVRPQRVIGAAGLGFAVALVVAALGTGRAPAGVVLAVLLAGGCCGPAVTGALSSLVPSLVAPPAVPRGFGLDSLSFNVAGIAGPAVVGVLAGVTSAGEALAVVAAGAGLGAMLIAGLRVDRVEPSSPGPRPSLSAGARFIAHDRPLRAVTLATGLGQLGLGALPVAAVLLAVRHGDAAAAGWLLTGFAAGALLGSVVWTARPASPARAITVVLTALVGTGVPLALAAAPWSLTTHVALFALAGVAVGPGFGALLVVRNRRAPERLRSQVFALGAGVKLTVSAAGTAVGGLLAGRVSVAGLLVVIGAISVLAAGVGRIALRERRRAVR